MLHVHHLMNSPSYNIDIYFNNCIIFIRAARESLDTLSSLMYCTFIKENICRNICVVNKYCYYLLLLFFLLSSISHSLAFIPCVIASYIVLLLVSSYLFLSHTQRSLFLDRQFFSFYLFGLNRQFFIYVLCG